MTALIAPETTTVPTLFDASRTAVEALSTRYGEPAWLCERRLQAWALYESLPQPTLGDEAWRRTDLRPLTLAPFADDGTRALTPEAYRAVVPAELLTELADAELGGLLVHHHARVLRTTLQAELAAQGVVFCDLRDAVRTHGDLLQKYLMTTGVPASDGKFAALHGALWQSGVFVYVPRGVQVSAPLHAILWADAANTTTAHHVLVVLEEQAALTLIYECAGPAQTTGAHLGITELFVGTGAQLRCVSLQSWGQELWHITHERARVGRDARLDWIRGETGSRVTKSFITVDLDGQGSTGRVSGFYFADGTQHLDLDTQQNHNAPHTTSDLLYKGALKDKARTVWQGMIRVEPGAQRTDGYQANRNLVLGKGARADSIPGLEIMANDVRCTHGATVGQLDQEHVFYLMTRGLPRPDAERLIVDGFFTDVMDRIPFEGLRTRLQAAISAKMGL